MDWKLFWTAFVTIFLAELGDKTQLGVLSFTAAGKSPATIFAAASLALILSTFTGVLAGSLLAKYFDPKVVRVVAGLLFIAVGLLVIFKRG
ncbi:MAG: hypothetical protein A2901_05710 [Elusimicrobia bacterium RIFCSPLOWO2_01_FULL_54_10]|nr:MAG: hypothetical protein A2901_05710 [Elusimicrobia bacterium RIFCSPLOWO2_01_FULL_54_10]